MSEYKFYVYYDKPRGGGRSYLSMQRFNFVWLDTDDFDTWDDCKVHAAQLTGMEAAIVMRLEKLSNPLADFEYDSERV